MIRTGAVAWIMLSLLTLALMVSGCQSPTPQIAPEPRVLTVDVPTIVQEKCKDQRPPVDEYPDTDAKLAGVADDDYEALSKAFRAGRDRRDARLVVDDVQIKGCAGD